MKRLVLLFLASYWAFPSAAGTGQGNVSQITAHQGDVIMFATGMHNNKPDCATSVSTVAANPSRSSPICFAVDRGLSEQASLCRWARQLWSLAGPRRGAMHQIT